MDVVVFEGAEVVQQSNITESAENLEQQEDNKYICCAAICRTLHRWRHSKYLTGNVSDKDIFVQNLILSHTAECYKSCLIPAHHRLPQQTPAMDIEIAELAGYLVHKLDQYAYYFAVHIQSTKYDCV